MIFTHDIYYPVAHRSQEEIESLKKRYETFDESEISDVMKKHGYTSISWDRPTTWGTSHVIYIVTVKEQKDPLILRANIGGVSENMMMVEKEISDLVKRLSIPVNEILVADISRKQFEFDYQIQKKLVGTDIEDHFHGTKEEYDSISFDIGKYVGMWGSIQLSGFGRFENVLQGTKKSMYEYIVVCLDEDIRYLADAKYIDGQKAQKIRALFEEYKDPINAGNISTLVHHDLADHNIMFDGKQTITGIFDWEAAVAGDPILDLASAPTWKTHFSREDKMVEGYRSIRDLPEYFEEKMNIYKLRTMLWKMVYAIRAGILNKDRLKKFDDALEPFKLS